VAFHKWPRIKPSLINKLPKGQLRQQKNNVLIFGKTSEEIDKIINERHADFTRAGRSPISGTIIARAAAPGIDVQPGTASGPYTIADTSTMWLVGKYY